MPSHANLIPAPGDARVRYEETLNREHALQPGEWRGPNTGAPKLPASQGYCDRLAAAAKERGRPLTPTEIKTIGRGEALPPITVAKPVKDRVVELESTVRLLSEHLDALKKKSVPPHMRQVEKRG